MTALRARMLAKGAAFFVCLLVAASNLPDLICGALGI